MKTLIANLSRTKFVRDVATMQVGQIVTTGSGFLASILFARLLGLGGYGTYAIVLAFTGLLGIVINLGQQTTALTFLSEQYGKKDRDGMREVIHYYFFLSLCGAIIMIALMPFLPTITTAMYGKPEIGKLARIIFLSSIIDPLFVFGSIVLQSVREIRKLTILENSRIVAQLGLSVLFLLRGMGVWGVLLGTLFGTALMSLVSLLMYYGVRKKYDLPTLKEVVITGKFGHIWRLGKDGLWIAIDKNVGNLYPNVFLVVLGMFTQESVVGLFRLAFKLGNLPASFVLSNISKLSASVIPALSGKGAGLKRSIIRLASYGTLIHVGATLGALLIVPPLISVVYGEAFSVAAYPFIVIAVLHITSVIHMIITPILRVYSRIYYATICNAIGFAVGLGAFAILVTQIRTTFAVYIGLTLYQVIALTVVVPVLSLLRRRGQL